MKRRWGLLCLPLVLGILAWCIKWWNEHPVPTQEDMNLRALMSHSSKIEVSHVTWGGKKLIENRMKLSEQEFQPFVDCFCLDSRIYNANSSALGNKGIITISPREDGAVMLLATISLDRGVGEILISQSGSRLRRNIHSATIKRWLHLMADNPRIISALQSS